jgi:hypothetical protein
LHFDCRARVYVLIVFGDQRVKVSVTNRFDLMPVLDELGLVPSGWHLMYGEGNGNQ